MRLGAPIFETYADPDAWIAAVQRRGYRAAYCPVKPDADAATIRAYAEAAERADIVIAECGAWSNPLSPDEETRRAAIAKCQAMLALADAIGARCCVNIAGLARREVGRPARSRSDAGNVRLDRADRARDHRCGEADPHVLHAGDDAVDVSGLGRQLSGTDPGHRPGAVRRASRRGQPDLQPAALLRQRRLDPRVRGEARPADQELPRQGYRAGRPADRPPG